MRVRWRFGGRTGEARADGRGDVTVRGLRRDRRMRALNVERAALVAVTSE